ncbi:MAG: protein kinase [Deltaproteobacteria bacterium]|nr:protein kinase [Deltaproteobacteria bacterium]
MDLQPQQKLGQYTVLRKLAEGGMAEIYLATRGGASGFSKNCVIKRVKAKFRTDAKFRAMFELEAKLAANLEHSNIVQIFDFQSSDGELFLAMQYVDGCSLEELRNRLPNAVMPPFLAARVARDVASALAYAWAKPGPDGQPLRLVHRDISPHNILVSREGVAKLTDFGIAKPVSKDTTGGFKGKIAYMSPEQARGDKVDARTDIFALGVVLFELCTGTRPYDQPTDIAFIHDMASGSTPAPRASALGAPVPEELADILERAVRRQPDQRYASAEELVRALEQFLRSAPSEVDVDLARFVVERLGAQPPPSDPAIPQLQTGALDDTLIPKNGRAGSVVAARAHDATAVPGARNNTGTPLQMPQLPAELAAPQSRVTPAPKPKREPTAAMPAPEPSDDAKATAKAMPVFSLDQAMAEEEARKLKARAREPVTAPARSEPEPTPSAPLLSGRLKIAAGVIVPVVLLGSALVAYRASRPEATVEKVIAPPPVVEPKPEPPKPVAVTTEPPKPVEPKPPEPKPVEQPKPAVGEAPKPVVPAPTPKPEVKHAVARARGTGSIKLITDPFADVYDGHKHISSDGNGPAFVVDAGHHELRFSHDGKTLKVPVEVPENGAVCVNAVFPDGKPPSWTRCAP